MIWLGFHSYARGENAYPTAHQWDGDDDFL
jgi:hypothetical protein